MEHSSSINVKPAVRFQEVDPLQLTIFFYNFSLLSPIKGLSWINEIKQIPQFQSVKLLI